MQQERIRIARDILLTFVLSLIFLLVSGFLFLIPLQFLLLKRGRKIFGYTAALLLAVITGLGYNDLLQNTEGIGTVYVLMNTGFVFSCVAGLYLLNEGFRNWRRLFILFFLLALFLPVSFPFMYYYINQDAVRELFLQIAGTFQEAMKESMNDETVYGGYFSPEGLFVMAKNALLGSYLIGYLVTMLIGWKVGTIFAVKTKAVTVRLSAISSFRIPSIVIWALIAAWGVELIYQLLRLKGLVLNPSVPVLIMRNINYCLVLIYSLQGIAILRKRMQSPEKARRYKRFIPMIVVVLIFMWPVNLILLLSLPVLGISETWLTLRNFERSIDNDQSNSE